MKNFRPFGVCINDDEKIELPNPRNRLEFVAKVVLDILRVAGSVIHIVLGHATCSTSVLIAPNVAVISELRLEHH
jgi:hypothetical protein